MTVIHSLVTTGSRPLRCNFFCEQQTPTSTTTTISPHLLTMNLKSYHVLVTFFSWTLKVWDLGPGSDGRLSPQAQTLPGGHSDYVLSVCFSQDGKYIISGSKDRSVTIWDSKLMKRVRALFRLACSFRGCWLCSVLVLVFVIMWV